MSTLNRKHSYLVKTLKAIVKYSLFVALLFVFVFFVYKVCIAFSSIKFQLTPPKLPSYDSNLPTQYINQSLGTEQDKIEFHHVSQGTSTLPIPYEWFIALEEPASSSWGLFLRQGDVFIGDYISRLGFIKSRTDNPLPIGIAKTDSLYFPGLERKATAVGFTCSACHTGQLVFDNVRYVIDGNPAVTDLGLLTAALGSALGQTTLSSQLPFFNGRFERFAKRVLKNNDNTITRDALKKELATTLSLLAVEADTINVTEGFTRLDALNRIGNQVFSRSFARKGNYQAIDAPVNYPHIWNTSWFNWVQYDASIMQPLIRNSGESLGVSAYVNTTAGNSKDASLGRFSSSVPIQSLYAIEQWLGGEHPLLNKASPKFNGLQSPQWPKELPPIDREKAAQGAQLYGKYCAGCHLPAVNTQAFWSDKYWKPISYERDGEKINTKNAYLHLNVVPIKEIGTDAAQSEVLLNRTVDTTTLGLNTQLCTKTSPEDGNGTEVGLNTVQVKDSATLNFALALGAFVQQTNLQWFKQNYTLADKQDLYEGQRPNCLQKGAGYKARPLNGIWATAPFLHNGSIASIYDLLSRQRKTFIELGNLEFDAKLLGVKQSEKVEQLNQRADLASVAIGSYYDAQTGLFILDTREQGNLNTGHLFAASDEGQITIGPELSEQQKMALVEYLKTL